MCMQWDQDKVFSTIQQHFRKHKYISITLLNAQHLKAVHHMHNHGMSQLNSNNNPVSRWTATRQHAIPNANPKCCASSIQSDTLTAYKSACLKCPVFMLTTAHGALGLLSQPSTLDDRLCVLPGI